MWGAYGETPSAKGPKQGFATPVHDISRGPDGLYYVCDRIGNRIQVFDVPANGTPRFVREISIAPETSCFGSAFAVAFSPCARFIYVPDGSNGRIWTIDIEDGAVLGWSSIGPEEGSDNHFMGANLIHRIAVDREGNILIARAQLGVQRWILKGTW
jgi:DNA-binding beta-propeller fold protein YncE